MLHRLKFLLAGMPAFVLAAVLLYPIPTSQASASAAAFFAPAAALPQPTSARRAESPFLASLSTRLWDHAIRLRAGDTISSVLDRIGLLADFPALMRTGAPTRAFRRLQPGQVVHIDHSPLGLEHLMLRTSRTEELHFRRAPDGGYTAERVPLQIETRERWYRNTIEDHLFEAGLEAGLSVPAILALANIFGWDIDFALEIRAGDRFQVLLEEQLVEGQRTGSHTILAAEFVNRGTAHRAFRFTTADGRTAYYSEDGRPLRKKFLRTPVDFTRISSRFSPRRLHPIYKVYRPHRGVDYAAPAGTPVYAAGDGTVLHKGRKSGYGHTVILKHGAETTTLYAHLSRYARGLRPGLRVQQKQVIGYVGSTGASTGPHLHYEFRVRGVHRDPLRIRPEKVAPLPEQERRAFRAHIWGWLAQLDAPDAPRLATPGPGSAASKTRGS